MPSSITSVHTPHVNDFGTTYKAEVQDQGGLPLNPTAASTKEFLFTPPAVHSGQDIVVPPTIVRTATVSTTGTGKKQRWFLSYTVVAADIVDGLHQTSGPYQWQAHLVFPSSEFYSNIHTYQVEDNLE